MSKIKTLDFFPPNLLSFLSQQMVSPSLQLLRKETLVSCLTLLTFHI
jgi:hypothetical protein